MAAKMHPVVNAAQRLLEAEAAGGHLTTEDDVVRVYRVAEALWKVGIARGHIIETEFKQNEG